MVDQTAGTAAGGRQLSDEMEECVRDCLNAHRVCVDTLVYCLERGDLAGRLARELLDCAEMCETAAHFLLRGSELHPRACALCAEVCAVLADACDEFADDPQLRVCADACRAASASCRAVASLMTA